jgi:hypothetical protein
MSPGFSPLACARHMYTFLIVCRACVPGATAGCARGRGGRLGTEAAAAGNWYPGTPFHDTYSGLACSTSQHERHRRSADSQDVPASCRPWRFLVDYLTRPGEVMPEEGVPFTAVVTIGDPDSVRRVFNDMRQNLQALGTQIADIRTAARITPLRRFSVIDANSAQARSARSSHTSDRRGGSEFRGH